MAPFGSSSEGDARGLRRSGDDAFQLTVDYIKQETIEPLKGLGRFMIAGLIGAFALAIGILLLLIGVLRVLQEETGSALTGDWSWVPYFVVSVLGLAVVGLSAWRITAGPGKARLPKVRARALASESVPSPPFSSESATATATESREGSS